MDASCKNHGIMTSYGGITRIRLKGRSSITSSQPAHTSSPVFIYVYCTSRSLYVQVVFSHFHIRLLISLFRYKVFFSETFTGCNLSVFVRYSIFWRLHYKISAASETLTILCFTNILKSETDSGTLRPIRYKYESLITIL